MDADERLSRNIDGLQNRLSVANAKLKAITELHYAIQGIAPGSVACHECGYDYPCPTVDILLEE